MVDISFKKINLQGETLKERIVSPIHIRGDLSTFSCFDVGTEYLLFFVQLNSIQTKLFASQSYNKSNMTENAIGNAVSPSTSSLSTTYSQNEGKGNASNNNSANSTLSKNNSIQKLQPSQSNVSNDPPLISSSKSTSQLISITTNTNASKEQSISDFCEDLKLLLTGFSL